MSGKCIGYLVSEYPAPSHTFIRREVDALRSRGLSIATFSIRRPLSSSGFSEADKKAIATTTYVLPVAWWPAIVAHMFALFRYPAAYIRALRWALFHSVPGLKSRLWSLFYFFEGIVLARELRCQGVTHIHNHFANASAKVGIVASRFLGIPWSVTLHGSADWAYPNGALLKEKIHAATFVACVSKYTRSQAMWIANFHDWRKMFVSHCGIDFSTFEKRERDATHSTPYRIITVGRLAAEKGQSGLLLAFAETLRRGMDAELRIIGAGPFLDELKAIATNLGISEKCVFLGQKTEIEVRDELAAADLFVMSSFMEGLPVVLMEALAMRLPSVAPCVAGIPELIQHEKTGLLFSPGDWDDLANQMGRAMGTPEMLKNLSELGYQLVKQEFNISTSVDELLKRFSSGSSDYPVAEKAAFPRHGNQARASNDQLVVAFIAPEIPALTATFVYEEILGLERLGCVIVPVSVRRPADSARDQEVLARRTHYLYDAPWRRIVFFGLPEMLSRWRGSAKAVSLLFSDMRASGLRKGSSYKLVYQFFIAGSLAKILRQEHCRHLHVHFAHTPAQIAMYASAISGVPFTITAHANDIFERGFLLRQKAERARKMLTISEFNRAFLESKGVPKDKLAVIRCGVSFGIRRRHRQLEPRATYRLGTLGRLIEKKGIDDLIRAVALMSSRPFRVELSVAGEGPLLDELVALAKATGVSDRVSFVGRLGHDHVSDWMGDLDAFVLACKRDSHGDMDGIPVVLMEAMSQSVPVVSTRLTGIPELVIHDKTGLLANADDCLDLAAKIEQLLTSPELCSRLTAEAALHVNSEFGQETNLGRLLAYIDHS